MIEVASSPPTDTYADVPTGEAFVLTANGQDYIKAADGNAIQLNTGAVLTPPAVPTAPVTRAAGATYTMFP